MKKPQKALVKLVLLILLAAQFTGLSFLFPKKLESANLTSVSDTLSNNRLSFRGELNGAVAVGSGIIVLETSGLNANNTSTGSGTLMTNESIRIGQGSTADVRTIKTLESETRVIVSSGLTTAANDGNPVIATVSAIHTVKFTPVSAIPNGAFRVLIPASSDANTGDGLPDKDGFDVTTGSLPTVSCGNISGYTFETGTATRSAITVSSVNYHSFECRYTGNGGTGTAITMTIGTAAGNKIINPSPSGYSASHGPGAGDTYTFRTRHTEGTAGSYVVADETIGRIGVIEAVRVTATVAPTITFMLTGVASSVAACSPRNTDVASTPNSVPLGSLSTTDWQDAAQILSVVTNATGGYSVTASESAALTAFTLSGTPTIPDTTCGATPCTVTTSQTWTNSAYKGFGYTITSLTGSPTLAFTAGQFRPFGVTAEQIFSYTAPVSLDQVYVCYSAIVSGTQQAGDYENQVIYIATATF